MSGWNRAKLCILFDVAEFVLFKVFTRKQHIQILYYDVHISGPSSTGKNVPKIQKEFPQITSSNVKNH